jgi:hypothetical protein
MPPSVQLRPRAFFRRSTAMLLAAALALPVTAFPTGAGAWSLRDNGRCDDRRYETSNGGRAEPGTDEYDCSRYGNGLKGSYAGGYGRSRYGRHDPYDRYGGYGYGHGSRDDRWDRRWDDGWGGDDDDSDAALMIGLGLLGLLGAAALLGGGDDGAGTGTGGGSWGDPGSGASRTELPGGGSVVWSQGGRQAVPPAVSELPVPSECQQVVRAGIEERYGTSDITFSGGPDEGKVRAGSLAFNYLCRDGRINVW